jgi:hypothetical protein
MKTNQTDGEGPAVSNAFLQVLQTHDGGMVCDELADAMRECVESVGHTGKPATLTLALKFTPAAKGAYGVVFFKPKTKKPEAERQGSIWYVDEAGHLTRIDPRQREFALRSVAELPKSAIAEVPPPKEIKQVG